MSPDRDVERKSVDRRVMANRRNAQKSTGPKTPEGKAIVAANAVQHGLLSWRPVLPDVERPEDWQAHLHRTLASLSPHGHLETTLAERLALLAWRLNRVARYEAATLAEDVANAASRTSGDDLRTDEEDDLAALIDLAQQSDGETIAPEWAAWVIDAVATHAGVETDTDADPTFVEPGWFPRESTFAEFTGWTAGRVREYLACVAARAARPPEKLWAAVVSSYRRRAAASRQRKDAQVRERHERAQLKALLPPAHKAQPLQRYEAAIERSLFRTLHELQRMQAARAGQAVVPPLVMDVDVSGDAGGAEHGALTGTD